MNRAADLLAVALAEVGYLEKKSNASLAVSTANAGQNNWTKYGAWYGLNGPDAYWCHIFVSWCASRADCTAIIPKTASCWTGRDWFARRGKFFKRAGFVPRQGDIIYFSSAQYPDGGAHVGIVERTASGKVYTVEGNTSGASGVITNGGGVARKNYPLSLTRIYGYGRPEYEEDDDMTTDEVKKIAREVLAVELYQTIDEVPDWAKPTIEKLITKGYLQGDGDGLDLTEDLMRTLVINDRAHLYG